jgi:hypothetical protein
MFAHSHETAAGVRREAKRLPAAVVRPRPCYQVMLIDVEDGDDRLARGHRARGWPGYIYVQGEPNDYVVLDPENRAIERSVDLERLGKGRAIRRLGTTDLRKDTVAIEPHELGR